MRRTIKVGVVLAVLPLMGSTCEPSEVRQFIADRRPSEVEAIPGNHPAHTAELACPELSLVLTNTGSERFFVSAGYGAHQEPLVFGVDGWYPYVEPGATLSIDLAPATGEVATVFLDNGAAHTINNPHC